jgi:hypothetical protein
MIVLVTDFGLSGPYTGQVKAVLHRDAPGIAVIDLFADAPAHNPKATAYLLAAYATWFPAGSVCLCVVDPGVGSERSAGILKADGRWYVGPDNGLFELVGRRAAAASWWPLPPPAAPPSATFHGRDLFAPAAARLALGTGPEGAAISIEAMHRRDWPDDLAEVIYIDHFGNAITGLRAATIAADQAVVVGGRRMAWARTFADVPLGAGFCYENANGLIEIAVNQGRADVLLGLSIGTPLDFDRMSPT